MEAAAAGSAPALRHLLGLGGADVRQTNGAGEHAALEAASHGHLQALRALLSAAGGARAANQTDAAGRTCLLAAARWGGARLQGAVLCCARGPVPPCQLCLFAPACALRSNGDVRMCEVLLAEARAKSIPTFDLHRTPLMEVRLAEQRGPRCVAHTHLAQHVQWTHARMRLQAAHSSQLGAVLMLLRAGGAVGNVHATDTTGRTAAQLAGCPVIRAALNAAAKAH